MQPIMTTDYQTIPGWHDANTNLTVLLHWAVLWLSYAWFEIICRDVSILLFDRLDKRKTESYLRANGEKQYYIRRWSIPISPTQLPRPGLPADFQGISASFPWFGTMRFPRLEFGSHCRHGEIFSYKRDQRKPQANDALTCSTRWGFPAPLPSRQRPRADRERCCRKSQSRSPCRCVRMCSRSTRQSEPTELSVTNIQEAWKRYLCCDIC